MNLDSIKGMLLADDNESFELAVNILRNQWTDSAMRSHIRSVFRGTDYDISILPTGEVYRSKMLRYKPRQVVVQTGAAGMRYLEEAILNEAGHNPDLYPINPGPGLWENVKKGNAHIYDPSTFTVDMFKDVFKKMFNAGT
jgi:hypothetical protein